MIMSLQNLFYPEKVAVVGASRHEGKTGHEVFDNLLHSFEGEVYPVNPEADEIEGVEAFSELQEGTDLAVIAVPARTVPEIIRNCGDKNVDTAVVISAGFSETGNTALASELEYIAEENDVKILGPNVLGLINTENGLNASFAAKTPDKGEISFMSQSGAFCTAMLDYATPEHLGFHHFVSLGNEMMIDETDLLEAWRNDDTELVLSYVEGLRDGREFIEEASKTSQEKPVITVKSGRTEDGGKAASSHTGSIAGSTEAYRAAFRKSGIIEAESSRELLDLAKAFYYQDLPEGENVSVVTNAGGPGVMAADEINEKGLELAEFEDSTRERLDEELPEEASKENPVDIIGDAGHRRYSDALEVVVEDGEVDAVVVILTPQANTGVEKTAREIKSVETSTEKPVFACFMGEERVAEGRSMLEEAQIPVYEDPRQAARAIREMNSYRRYLERERTFRDFEIGESERKQALQQLEASGASGDLLELYGFDLAMTETVDSPQEAVDAASRIGYPVTLKADSRQIKHKTDEGGVITDISTRKDVQNGFKELMQKAYTQIDELEAVQVQEQIDGLEVAVGMKRDPQFGPVVMVGLGGIYVEVLQDVSFGVAPLSEQEAEEMIQELRSTELFKGVRGEKHSLAPVKQALTSLGRLALDNPEIQTVDINPLILKEEKAYVADVEIELEDG